MSLPPNSNWREIFKPDSGTLLDITVPDVRLSDWQRLLTYLQQNHSLTYSEDGVEKPLPNIQSIFGTRLEHTVLLKVITFGFAFHCHFFLENEVQMDLLPDDIDTGKKAEVVFQLMIDIANCLGREVFLVAEGLSGTHNELREWDLCVAGPDKDLSANSEHNC